MKAWEMRGDGGGVGGEMRVWEVKVWEIGGGQWWCER